MTKTEPGAATTLLIVEDHDAMRALLREHLRSAYPTSIILEAADGARALELCRLHNPRLVLMDVGLPDANGIELIPRIKALVPECAVIVVSRHAAHVGSVYARAAGAFAYVSKDAIYRELLKAVANALRGATAPLTTKAIKVLILDDSEADAELALRELRLGGFEVQHACVESAAAFKAALRDEYWDAVISDFNMRGFTGLEALRMFQSAGLDIPFILISGTIGEETAVEAMKAGAGDYVMKANLARLAPALKRELQQALVRAEQKRAVEVLRESEAKIRRLNRVYAVLSGINGLLVRVRKRDELFREACRIAVESGKFLMAWLGVVDREAMQVKPVAWAGDVRDFFDSAPLAVTGTHPGGHGLAGRAVREMKPIVSNDVRTDPQRLMKKECEERGINSLAVIPLIVGGDAVGILALYAADTGFFDDEELKLLLELAGDISFALDHIEKEEKLQYLAYHDSLTGLANATLFHERVDQHVHDAGSAPRKVAVLLVDVDRFKTINDTLGRRAGDEILAQISTRLLRSCGDAGHLARVSADRFAMVMPEVQTEQEVARRTEEQLRTCFGEAYRVGDTELRIAASVGISLYPADGADAHTLFRNAESALKKTKESGERYLFYTQQMTERTAERLALESKLRRALDRQEFLLYYQPKFDTQTRSIAGVEALIRWQSPELGLVPPMQFIPLLEETGLIFEVGAWALRQAALEYRRWQELGFPAPRVAVNVSPIQLRRRDFVESVRAVLGQGNGAVAIDLELTESLIMEDIHASIEKLEALRNLGVEIAIDDFGTGYSSLAYLAKLPVQTLKIDRSFIITMLEDAATMTLVSTIISMAHSLKLKVVAEGVDSDDQMNTLRHLGCDQVQGYLFSKPVSFDEMTAELQSSVDQAAARVPASDSGTGVRR